MIGKLVRYRGWSKTDGPLALVVDERPDKTGYHHRIRVCWVGDEIPIQANALSTSKSRITTWVSPGHFEIVGKEND